MTKRRKDTDYLFLSARIRAMERRLLTAQRLEQLLAEDPALTRHPATAERVRKLFQQSENSLN